jgi:hypothetical protein
MAERHGMHVPAKDCGLRLGTSLAFPLEHAHHRAAILQHPSPRSSRHPGSRNGSQTGT